MKKLKYIKLFENYLQSKYELIGNNIGEVLDAINSSISQEEIDELITSLKEKNN